MSAGKMSVVGLVLIAVAAMTAFVVPSIYWLMFVSGPSIHTVARGSALDVDLTFLGEYCIGVSRVRILEQDGETVVLDVVPKGGDTTGICRFTLRPGLNDVRLGQRADEPLKS